jgi:uncharacterized protein (TIGR02231 family)
MRMMFAAILLASTSFVSAEAAEFSPTSKIDAVTVFPQGADVVRVLEIDVPVGEHSLILKDLPQTVDPQSIRVEGASDGSLLVGSVDTRNKFQGETNDAARKSLEKQIQDLGFERQALDLSINDLNQQRTILMSLADKQLVPQSTDQTVKPIDAVQLGALVDLVGQKLSVLSKDILAAQKRQRDIDEKSNDLNAQLAELAPTAEYRTEVVLNIEAKEAQKSSLRVSYRVQEASWVPFYDARLSIGDGKSKPGIELVQRAEVVQNTGEKWDSVEMKLSTARPGGATASPEMSSWEITRLEPVQNAAPQAAPPPLEESEMDMKQDSLADGGSVKSRTLYLNKSKAILQRQAVVEQVGFQATYVIAGRVSVDNAGQSKKVRITSNQNEATLSAIAVPRVDPVAYLTATFNVSGSGPQLPGTTNLYRDGVYVGQGYLPLLNPTEEAKLGFGPDDLVKVERAEVKRVQGEEGLLTSSNVDERAWDITIKNLHDFAIPVRVIDRVPFTASKEIEITELATMTAPSVRDLDKKRGVHAWDMTVEPKAEQTLKTGYKITWPEGMQVSVVD